MTIGQWTAMVLLVGLGGYIIYRVKTLNNVTARLKRIAVTAEGHNALAEEAIRSSNANTQAINQNTEALRELMALQKQLLHSNNQGNP